MTKSWLRLFSTLPLICLLSTAVHSGELSTSSVVFIQAGYTDNNVFVEIEEGSGFVLNAQGWVLTAKHVVDIAVPPGKTKEFRASVASRDNTKYQIYPIDAAAVAADFALLRFQAALPVNWSRARVLANHNFSTDDKVTMYGFPIRLDLSVRKGDVSNVMGPNGTVVVSGGLAPGMSGGPVVLGNSDCVVGIISGTTGQPGFDYFTPTQFAQSLLNVPPADFVYEVARSNANGESAAQLFDRAYHVDQTKDDHQSSKSSQYYQFSFDADPGAKVVSARWVADSAAAEGDLSLNISADHGKATFRFRLESGPFFDQWRGWWHGQVILTQERDVASANHDDCHS